MKAMVGLIVAILIIFGLRLFWPSNEYEVSGVSQNEVTNEQAESPEVIANETDLSSELNAPSDDEKRELMTAEYEILEQARKKLKRHVSHLKHDMWGLKFASDTAKKMSTSVMSASRLLKNPHMLGAFSGVEGIKDEIAKVKFAEKSLVEVDEIIEANKSNSDVGSD